MKLLSVFGEKDVPLHGLVPVRQEKLTTPLVTLYETGSVSHTRSPSDCQSVLEGQELLLDEP